jgi:transcriptional regulator with XRE-family HTH domain
MEELGRFLAEGRQAAGLSLEELEERTRIRLPNLVALEAGDHDPLPSVPYVRGFVRLVCRELGLSEEDGVGMYERLLSPEGGTGETTWAEERSAPVPGILERALQDPDRILGTLRVVGRWGVRLGAVALAVAVVATGVRWVSGGSAEDAPLAVEERSQAEVGAPTDRETVPREVEEPIVANERAVAIEHTPVAEPTHAEAEPTPPSPSAEAPSGRVRLAIHAVRAVEVSVLLDGAGYLRRQSLRAGESGHWTADSLFLVSVADGGAVRLEVNGRDLGPAGPDGRPLESVAVRAAQ